MSLALAVIVTVPLTVEPAVGAVIEQEGGVVSLPPPLLLTVTVTVADVPMLLAASYAFVTRLCEPFAVDVDVQLHEYGEVVSVLWSAPSR